MNSSRLLTFGRVLMAVIFVILATSYTYAQEGRPEDEELGEAATILLDSANWLKQKDNGDKCSLLKDAKALLVAIQVLRTRLVSDKGEIQDTKPFISALEKNDIAAACIPTSSVPKPTCGLGKPVRYGGHEAKEPVPEMVLAYLYMTEDDREKFLKDLSPVTRSALTDWFHKTPDTVRNDIITSVSEEIGSETSWPLEFERSINADENDIMTAYWVSQLECEDPGATWITTGPQRHKRLVPEMVLAFLYIKEERREKFVENTSLDTDLLLTDWLYEPDYEEQSDILKHINEEFPYTAQSDVRKYIYEEFPYTAKSDVQKYINEESPFSRSWPSEFNLSGPSDYEIEDPDNGIFDPWE